MLENESLYLMYRRFFPLKPRRTTAVQSAEVMAEYISERVRSLQGRVGIMLSGGMDSAILVPFLPKGSVAYTFEYGASRAALSEFAEAKRLVPAGVEHKRVLIHRDTFFAAAREATVLKQEPTVPHDPAFLIAAQEAIGDGVEHLVTGIGADGRFGGFAHFYVDPTFDGLKHSLQKQFVAPWKVLKDPAPVDWVIRNYEKDDIVDVQRFLGEVGTEGRAIYDTLSLSGVEPCSVYGEMTYEGQLSPGTAAKAPLRELFKRVYPGRQPNRKVPLLVPYSEWLRGYEPERPEFHVRHLSELGGKRKYQVYALELYMDLRDERGWVTPDPRSPVSPRKTGSAVAVDLRSVESHGSGIKASSPADSPEVVKPTVTMVRKDQVSESSRSEERLLGRQRVRFLLVGMPRSGVTVAHSLMSELEGVSVPQETCFWSHAQSLSSRFQFPLNRRKAEDAIDWFAARDSSSGLAINREGAMRLLGSESYLWDLFEALVSSLSPPGTKVLGEMTPDHARWADELMRAVPSLVVIGVIQDPREVFWSHLSSPTGIKAPRAFAGEWLEFSRTLEDLLRLFPERSKIARYEDLVENPDEFRLDAARLIGAAVAEPALRLEGIEESAPPASGESGEPDTRVPARAVRPRWIDELQAEQVFILERQLGSAMQRWGYETEVVTGHPEMLRATDSSDVIRHAGSESAKVSLPINRSTLGLWHDSDQQQLSRSKRTSEELRAELLDLRSERRHLVEANAAMTEQKTALNRRVASLSSEADRLAEYSDAWRGRAETLNDERARLREWVRAEKVMRLRSERQRLIANGKLKRFQARRWWKLGGALGRWRRRPYRIDLLLRDIWRLATSPNPLPPIPDTTRIDQQLDKLTAEGHVRGSQET